MDARQLRRVRLIATIVLGVVLLALTAYAIALEPKRGSISGVVMSTRTSGPLPGARVIVSMGRGYYYEGAFRTETDEQGRFEFPCVPAGEHYTILAKHPSHQQATWPHRVRVDEGINSGGIQLELLPRAPSVALSTSRRFLTTQDEVSLRLSGYLQDGPVHVVVRPVDIERLYRVTGKIRNLTKRADFWQTPLREFDHVLSSRDKWGEFHERLLLKDLPGGAYVVTAYAADSQDSVWFVLSDIGLTVKRAPRQLLAYVVDFGSNEPLPGAGLTCYRNRKPTATGRTDEHGLFFAALGEGAAGGPVFAHYGSSLAWANAGGGGYETRSTVYLYTDRPIYRPGHTVRFKGIARRRRGNHYVVPANAPVTVRISDSRGGVAYSRGVRTTAYGSFVGQFELGNEAPLGRYSLDATFDGEECSAYFKVEEYRKPEYKVEVSSPQERYLIGERVPFTVDASYYFGAPLQGAELTYSVYRGPYWDPDWAAEESDWWYEGEYGEGDYYYGGYGELITHGTARLDDKGRAVIWVDNTEGEGTQRITLEAEVADASNRAVTGRGYAICVPALIRLRASVDKYVYSRGEPLTVVVEAQDYNKRPSAGLSVTVKLTKSTWRKTGRYDWEEIKRDLATQQATTDAKGKAQVTFARPPPGDLRVVAEAHDPEGRLATTERWVWVEGAGRERPPWEREQDLTVDLVRDQKEYQIGEVAKVLINCSHKDAHALLTVEGPKIFRREVVRLKDGSATMTIPMTEEHVPNVYACATIMSQGQFTQGETLLKLGREHKELRIAVQSDKEAYEPGETAHYLVQVTDRLGRPQQAEVSLGVVDEAIYALQPELAGDIVRFFWGRRYNAVSTNYSFPRYYYGGVEKLAGMLKVRKKFEDTAYWAPLLRTDANGRVTAEVPLPDNLTTWRATVRAHTLGTEVGAQTQTIKTQKPLVVRLATPRFFTQKDELDPEDRGPRARGRIRTAPASEGQRG